MEAAVSLVIESDLLLAAAVLRRDRKASADFVQLHADGLYSYVRFRLLPRIDAVDDIVQDVFLAAWKSLPNYRGTAPLKVWLLGIARHRIEDHYRQVLRSVPFPDDSGEIRSDEAPPDVVLARNGDRDATAHILSALPPQYRAVLLWRYWDGRSAEQISVEIGKTPKAVERLLARARQQFRAQWQEREAAR